LCVFCESKFAKLSQALVAHAYNPSYSGGRDQEDRGLKPAWGKRSKDPISKHPSQKRAGGMAQGIGPEFKPQYKKKNKVKLELKTDEMVKVKIFIN
jgi:hypothetical protein